MNFEEKDVLLAMQQDNDAFANIYKSIYVDLFKMALYIIGDRELAKDIVSETIIDAYKGIAGLKDALKFEQWILRILTMKCKRRIKEKYNTFSVFSSNARNIDDCILKSQDSFSDKDEMTDVQIALSKLNSKDRTIVTLCIVEGYKSHEVADILSMNSSTVRSRLNRSLRKMREYLEVK